MRRLISWIAAGLIALTPRGERSIGIESRSEFFDDNVTSQIEESIYRLPNKILDVFLEEGTKIVVADRLDEQRDLEIVSGVHVFSYPNATISFDYVPFSNDYIGAAVKRGFYRPIFDSNENRDEETRYCAFVKPFYLDATLHELGHVANWAIGQRLFGTHLHLTDEFNEVYEGDKNNITYVGSYYLNPSEWYAESFRRFYSDREDLEKKFPRTAQFHSFIEDKL